MRGRLVFGLALIAVIFTAAAAVSVARQAPSDWAPLPGPQGHGVTLLPNGWRIQPAGQHLSIGDLPLAMALSPDGHSLIVTNNGYQKPTLRVVNLDHRDVTGVVSIDDAWLGLAWHPDGKRLFSSGAASNTVQEFSWANQQLKAGAKTALVDNMTLRPGQTRPAAAQQTFIGGIAINKDGTKLYAVHVFGQRVSMLDLATGKVTATQKLPAEPYTTVLSPDGTTLFVSLWGGARVLMFDAATLAPKGEIEVGEHPNAMVFSADGTRLFVACANTNSVWAVDIADWQAERADLGRALSERAGGLDAERARGLTGRPEARRRQRRQQRRRDGGHLEARPEPRARLHPDRLVSDERPLQPRRQRPVRPEREGPHVDAEPARRAGGRANRPGAVLGIDAGGRAVDRADAECGGARGLHEDGLRAHALQRRDAPRAGLGARARRRFRDASATCRPSSTCST